MGASLGAPPSAPASTPPKVEQEEAQQLPKVLEIVDVLAKPLAHVETAGACAGATEEPVDTLVENLAVQSSKSAISALYLAEMDKMAMKGQEKSALKGDDFHQMVMPPRSALRKKGQATNSPKGSGGRGACKSKWWWPFAKRRRQVSFEGTVRVKEFSRMLDGGNTMPGDGSIVTLGLGRLVRTSSERLAPSISRSRIIEDTLWIPARDRVKLLRKAMGDARFFREWVKHKGQMKRLSRSRSESQADPTDQTTMPESMEEALERAKAMHEQSYLFSDPKPIRVKVSEIARNNVRREKVAKHRAVGVLYKGLVGQKRKRGASSK